MFVIEHKEIMVKEELVRGTLTIFGIAPRVKVEFVCPRELYTTDRARCRDEVDKMVYAWLKALVEDRTMELQHEGIRITQVWTALM
jgi:hypothetical protein